MYSVFTKLGFKDVTNSVNLSTGAGLQRGDVLLNHVHHVAMYCGNGKEVEASINEKGGARGGKPGDQTGREILIRSYRNYPWNAVLRYGATTSSNNTSISYTTVRKGSTGSAVKDLQTKLNKIGYKLTVDGIFGGSTYAAVVAFQKKYSLEVDGVVGKNTWAKLNSLVSSSTSTTVKDNTATGSVFYVGKVTATELNVRVGPGTSYDKLTSYPVLKKGNLIDVYKEMNGWLYVRIAGKHYGYVSAKYVTRS